MELLRTPDSRFENLPGYPFDPNYVEIDGVRIHYVDEGPRDADPVLMLHGEPSWSYLYRHMIPPIVAAGYRALAPDLVGFGRSDKPAHRDNYTYQRHVDWIAGWLAAVDLTNITLMCQDWGSLIGLRLAAEHPDRFARIVLSNGGLPTGDQEMPEAFTKWQQLSQALPQFPVGLLINGATTTDLTADVIAAYDAPFPDESFKEGARIFPMLVPSTPDDPANAANRAAWDVLKQWEKPFLLAFSDKDPVTRGGEAIFKKLIPGTTNMPHTTIADGGHFLQEDKGPELAQLIIDFIAAHRD